MSAAPLSALALGATLYVPATRDDLAAVLLGQKRAPGLRSAVLCLEDAVLDRDVPVALSHLSAFLRTLTSRGTMPGDPLLFVRPRDAAMLEHILCMPGAGRLDGFVVPKAHAETIPAYLALPLHDGHRLMPTLETREACDPHEMRRLRDQLLVVQDRILAVRIGGNDLMRTMGLRRAAGRTAYDGPLGHVIAGLVACFAPWGFTLSAPVFERFANTELLREEVARDIEHGLLTKTAIHPDQIAIIQGALAVPAADIEDAQLILADDAPAVFARGGAMCEPATHRAWAERLLARAAIHGIVDSAPLRLVSRSRCMTEFRTKIDEQQGAGIRFEVYQCVRKSYALGKPAAVQAAGGTAGTPVVHVHSPHPISARQVRIVLDGGAALLEPGALQYARGRLDIEMQKNAGAGGFFQRAMTSAGSGESAFATRYSGCGEVWTEVTVKHFILAAMEGPQNALILDDGAFYACDANIAVSTHVHRSVQGLLSGNGLMQPKLTGQGAFVVEAPVPVDEIEVVELDGHDELVVDGDLMLMYSAGLQVELRPLVRGLRNALRSGEGLVYRFTGRGTVWLTPTMRLG